MNLHWIDWTIMIVAVVALRLVSLSTRRYMKGVSDFLAANRLAGRYLLTIAQEMGREINTIGSKANDASIQRLVVGMKDELEKIKEQLANIL